MKGNLTNMMTLKYGGIRRLPFRLAIYYVRSHRAAGDVLPQSRRVLSRVVVRAWRLRADNTTWKVQIRSIVTLRFYSSP